MTQSSKPKVVKPTAKKTSIKSFIYYAPVDITKASTNAVLPDKQTPKIIVKSPKKPITNEVNKVIPRPQPSIKKNIKTTQPRPLPAPKNKKLDSFTQLQRMRSKLNKNAVANAANPYQPYQPPSIFNTSPKLVPHSVPLKDKAQESKKNTKHMSAGVAITKGDDGTCSISQNMSVYGLNEGSSTQYFACGESKFEQNFREHMKKVNTKLGKK